MEVRELRRFSHVRTAAISDTGRFVAVVGCLATSTESGSFLILVDTISGNHRVFRGTEQAFVSVSFHPEEKYVVVGSVSGSISCLFCLSSSNFKDSSDIPVEINSSVEVQTVTQHWHHTPCTAVSVSPCRTFLVSGGAEGVLVLWNERSQNKQFLSRLGAPVTALRGTITRKGHLMMAVSLANNSVAIVDLAEMRVVQRIASFCTPLTFHTNPDLSLAASWKQKTKSLFHLSQVPAALVDARPVIYLRASDHFFRPRLSAGHELQLYDVSADLASCVVDVSDRQYVSNPISDVLANYGLDHSEFSRDGRFLCTVESRTTNDALSQNGSVRLTRLKLWSMQESLQEPQLVRMVSVSEPVRRLIALDDTFITVHRCHWRVWRASSTDIEQVSVGSYKGQSISDAFFAPDGSTLCVVHTRCVSLWHETDFETLRDVFVCRRPVKTEWQQRIRSVGFVGPQRLVVGRATDVFIYNLASQQAEQVLLPPHECERPNPFSRSFHLGSFVLL